MRGVRFNIEILEVEIELRQVISTKCRDEAPPELKRRIADALGTPLPPDDAATA